MSLYCGCDRDDAGVWLEVAQDFSELETKRARHCCSCGERLAPGDTVVVVLRWQSPRDDIREKILGEDGRDYLANWYLCETCGGLVWAVEDLGLCYALGPFQASIKAQIAEYMAERTA